MNKKFLLLTLLMALFAPWAAKAQSKLTVCEGTTTSNVIPAYVFEYTWKVRPVYDVDDKWSDKSTFTTTENPEIIVWDEPGDWPSGEIPPAGADVIIPDNSIVVIPDDYTANVGEITMGAGSSIVIEEGGQLYHTEEVEVIMEMNVPDGYNAKNSTGWRLFACPVTTTSLGGDRPIEGTNLNTGTFDLYKFDEGAADGLEWINYKGASFATDPTDIQFFNLVRTEGYLYANTNQSADIVMRGYTPPTVSTYEVPTWLSKTAGAEFEGVNLVGNPFTCKAYVSNNNGDMPYYVMNYEGTGFNTTAVAAGTPIYPMKAVFVLATIDNEECMFKTIATRSSKGSLNITVNQGRGIVDNAILSFGNGNTLEKFQFDPNHTKVYMPVDGIDYAVANAESNVGEMPVSFKAENNGSYTISFSSENVEFNYLHLIDNMTGNDVNLLANPSYSFEARTTDYASRFKLVYATDSSNDGDFAFMCNGSLVISNEGNATLQVIDVNGRILRSESINGSANVSMNTVPGVYMIRLVDGDNVRTQKIVVK